MSIHYATNSKHDATPRQSAQGGGMKIDHAGEFDSPAAAVRKWRQRTYHDTSPRHSAQGGGLVPADHNGWIIWLMTPAALLMIIILAVTR